MDHWCGVAQVGGAAKKEKKMKIDIRVQITYWMPENNINRRKKMWGIRKKWFQQAEVIAKSKKTMFLVKIIVFNSFWPLN